MHLPEKALEARPIVIGGAAVVLLALLAFMLLAQRTTYTTATVVRAPIAAEVLASGHVESPTTAALSFKGSGTLVALPAVVGQHVRAGAVLARQDASVLAAQLAQAEALTRAASSTLAKLEAGATPQTVAVARASVQSAALALANAYATVASAAADAKTKATDAVVNQLARFFTDGATDNPKLTFTVTDAALANRIVAERAAANTTLAAWQGAVTSSSPPAALDQALAQADARLGSLLALSNDAAAAVAANAGLSTTDAATYRTSAATGLAELNAARTAIETLAHTIASDKAAVASAEASLNLTTASTTVNDLDAQRAAVASAEANAAAIAAEMRNLTLVAPFAGTVTDTIGSVGETVGPGTAVVSLMPDARLEVKANVSEDNIVAVALGDPARIELDAFPTDTSFKAQVSAIDPAATVSGGAIYYQTTLLFDTLPSGVRSGMTANVWIETASSTDALVVPASALTETGTTTTVSVLENGTPTPRTVTTGIKSQSGMVEILSGLSAGDAVVTGS